jgi:hypothetical protein
MNALARRKVVLALIATFAAGAITGGFLTGRAIRDAMRRAEQPRQPSTLTVDRWQRELHLKPERANEIGSILTQMDNELNNLRALDVREDRWNLLSRKDRTDPIIAPDQGTRLQEILDEHRRHFEETACVPQRPD